MKSTIPKISELCDKAIKEVESTAKHSTVDGQHIVEYDVIDLTVRMFSSVVMECFLGGATDHTL